MLTLSLSRQTGLAVLRWLFETEGQVICIDEKAFGHPNPSICR